MKVSTLLITYNEEKNLPRCLMALSWCDDIIVVDSGSTDKTVEIAQRYNARILHRSFDNFAAQRNFGIIEGKPRYRWLLHLDADEVVTPEFEKRLVTFEPNNDIDAYAVPSKLMLFGRWLRHAGSYPVYQVRLGRADRLRFKMVGHGQREDIPSERIGVFDEPYLHFSFSHGIRNWLEKHIVYAEAEAAHIIIARRTWAENLKNVASRDDMTRRRVTKELTNRLPLFLRPFFRFFYIYIIRGGYRDGAAGFCYAFMIALYEANISILAYEMLSPDCNREL